MSIKSFFAASHFHMTDVSAKPASFRRAIAMGRIYIGAVAMDSITKGILPKGDVLKLAEMAGIQGAKNAGTTIPLCHPLALDYVAVHLEPEPATCTVAVYCIVATIGKTGVEMEALAGVNAASLTVYDLVKPVEPALEISGIRLLLKEGGKKGLWIHPQGVPEFVRELTDNGKEPAPLQNIAAAVLTLSDRANAGVYEDRSGTLLQSMLQDMGADIVYYRLLPDEPELLSAEIKKLATDGKIRLLICTGGTGLAPRDITPDVVLSLLDRSIPGIGELLRSSGARQVPHAWLSRSVAGIIGSMLVITLPGSRSAVQEGMMVLRGLLPHALNLLAGKKVHDPARHKSVETA